MKKKKILSILIIVSAVSVLVTCDLFGTIIGTIGGIPLKAKSFNNEGDDLSQGRSIARNVQSMGIMPLFSNGGPVETAFEDFYSDSLILGDYVDSYTPTKFIIASFFRVLFNDGEMAMLGAGFLDYVSGVTIELGDIPPGITVHAIGIDISAGPIWFPDVNRTGTSIVEFLWPNTNGGGKTESFSLADAYNQAVLGGYVPGPPGSPGATVPDFIPSITNEGLASIHFSTITPAWIGKNFDLDIGRFVYGGSERKFMEGGIELAEVLPNIPNKWPLMKESFGSTLVIPMPAQTISSSASSVTLDISWNLEEIISHYRAPGETNATADDIFVLRDGWWNDLYLTISVSE